MASSKGKAVYDGLVARGFSAPQAAALAGNIQQESAFNPAAWNNLSGAGGLLQWRQDRLAGLQNFAKSTGRPVGDIDTQLDYLVHEMQGPEAKNVAGFLGATDVQSANAALKPYIRYGKAEGGSRLANAMAFAQTPASTPAADAAAQEAQGQPAGQFVNPAFPGSLPAPQSPVAAPAATTAPQPAPASPDAPGGPSDDDVLKAWLPAASTDAVAPVATPSATPAAPNGDDDLLKQFLPPASPGAPQTPGALGNNPMAVKKPAPTATDYVPSSVPTLDQVSAFGNAAANAVPIVGPMLTKVGNSVDAGFNNLLGYPVETPDDVAAQNAAEAAKFPIANAAGTVTGAVGPLALGGATVAGGKLLGTTGNLLTRSVMSGLSSGAVGGADTLARGGNVGDAARNALLDTVVGGVVPTAGFAVGGGTKAIVPRIAAGAAAGGVVGGGGTLLAGGDLDQAEHNAMMGAGIGAAAGATGAVGNRLVGAMAPAPEIGALAQLARDKYHIPLGPGQITDNQLVRRADALVNKVPFSGGTASAKSQNEALTRAIAGEMGTNASALTPAVMGATKTRIGNVFQTVAKNTPSIPADPQFDNAVLGVMSAAHGSLTPQQLAPLNRQFDDIMDTFRKGGNAINGDTYLSITSRGSPLDAAMSSSDPGIATYARQLKDALDDVMQRSATPAEQAALQQARYQWKVMRTVEDMAEKAPVGAVSPALLMGAVRKNFPNMAYDGGGNMGDLARIASQFMKEPGTSGTAENLKLAGAGAAAINMMMNPSSIPLTALAAGGILGGSRVAAATLRSDGLANMLLRASQGAPSPGTSQGINALFRGAVPGLLPTPQGDLTLPPGAGGPNGPLRIVVRGANAAQ